MFDFSSSESYSVFKNFFFISITISKFFLKMYSFFISTMAVVDSRKILRKLSCFFLSGPNSLP